VRRLAVTDVPDVKAQSAQHASGPLDPAAEIMRTHGLSGGQPVGDAEDRLGVVGLAIDDEQVGSSPAESVVGEEFVLAQPVVLRDGLPHVMLRDNIPERHWLMVGVSQSPSH
jgi:hypothetical protein